jgi:hypothetical protein
VWVRLVFNEYRILYESGQARRELLDEVAKNFFRPLNKILVEYILLNMCKLTDPAGSRQDGNLTVKYILKLIGPETAKQLGLDKLSQSIHSLRPHILDARNKIIAHLDKETALSKGFLGAFPRETGDAFWRDLEEFVNRVNKHYFERPFPIDAVNMYNAENLVQALKKGVHYDDYFMGKGRQKLEEQSRMRYKDA